MPGDERHGTGMRTMRQRDAGEGGGAQRRGHARDDFEGDAGLAKNLGLFRAAPEYEWVPPLETHDTPAAPAAWIIAS